MDVSEIGPSIRAARVAAGLSQADVARRIGVAQPTIGYYERGVRAPGRETIYALGEFLTLSVEEMLAAEGQYRAEVNKKLSAVAKKRWAQADVREMYSQAAKKRHERERAAKMEKSAAPPKPRTLIHSLTPTQKLAAVNWTANQEGMSYGQFVTWIRADEYPGIYERYRAHLNGEGK